MIPASLATMVTTILGILIDNTVGGGESGNAVFVAQIYVNTMILRKLRQMERSFLGAEWNGSDWAKTHNQL